MRRLTTLSPLSRGWIARVGLFVLLGIGSVPLAYSQTTELRSAPENKGYNKEMRRHTWSIYTQAGTSWTRGVWYPSINAKRSYEIAPAVGGGVNYNIQPWVRIGTEYIWSRYRREQRFSSLPDGLVAKAYGNYLVNYHNAKLGAEFNLMEFWPRRGAQWLNIYLGTGIGGMLAEGNVYDIHISTTKTLGGVTTPAGKDLSLSNDSKVSFQSSLRTHNEPSSFKRLYLPASLHVEADVSRQFSLGLKGEMDWILNRKSVAPQNLIYALASVRYNFVPSKAKALAKYYDEEISILNGQINDLQRQAEEALLRATKAEDERDQLQQQAEELRRSLEESRRLEGLVHVVQFENDSYIFSRAESERLTAFAQRVRGRKLTLIAEASTPSTPVYNQRLSERRLERVVNALVSLGFSKSDLTPRMAIGSQSGISSGIARRVTIQITPSDN